MRANLRITAQFDPVTAEQIKATTNQDNPALTNALIIDDAANLIHEIKIEYDSDDDGNIYRRLNYKMISMINNNVVLGVQNIMAQELLYKIATALTGSTLTQLDPMKNSYQNRNFDKSMFILGPNDGTWDDVLPSDFNPNDEALDDVLPDYDKPKRKPAAKKETKQAKQAAKKEAKQAKEDA